MDDITLHHVYWLSSNSTYLDVGLQIECHTEIHYEFWLYNVPRNERDKAVVGLVDHALGFFICNTNKTALLCNQRTITTLKPTVVSIGLLKTVGTIRDGVTVSSFQESELFLVFWSAVHEVWQGDFDTFAEFVGFVSFDL